MQLWNLPWNCKQQTQCLYGVLHEDECKQRFVLLYEYFSFLEQYKIKMYIFSSKWITSNDTKMNKLWNYLWNHGITLRMHALTCKITELYTKTTNEIMKVRSLKQTMKLQNSKFNNECECVLHEDECKKKFIKCL